MIAANQMLWSALLIHLSGGRIETHFHVFGSLAFLAFYRDWRVLLTATVVVAADHLIARARLARVGVRRPQPRVVALPRARLLGRLRELGAGAGLRRRVKDMMRSARQQAEVEVLTESDEAKTLALEMALAEARR